MDIGDNNFEEEVIEKSKDVLVIVDFWAEWCAPCNMLTPILKKVVNSYGNKVILRKVNIDENPKTANKFRIDKIPTVKLFKDGKIVSKFIGVVSEETIKEIIDKNL